MSDIPTRPQGESNEARFQKAVWEKLWGRREVPFIKPSQQIVQQSQGLVVGVFDFVKAFSEYITATDSSGVLTQIARPPELRCSILARTIDGGVFTYAYQQPPNALAWVARTVTSSSLTGPEYQRIRPIYFAGIAGQTPAQPATKIIAIKYTAADIVSVGAAGGDTLNAVGTPITWIQISDNRMWVRKVDQTQP